MEFAQARLRREGASNTEWIETGLKAALFADARGMVESLLNDPQVEVAGAHKLTGEKRGGMQEKTVQSMFGSIRLRREYFYHPGRGCGRYPLDEALGLENGYTPAAVRLMCRAGARDAYEEGSADLLAYAGLEISAQEINRMVRRIGPQMRSEMEAEKLVEQAAEVPRLYVSCDGTGVPMRRSELVGVKGKGADGKASTREVKVGCVFTQHPKEGR